MGPFMPRIARFLGWMLAGVLGFAAAAAAQSEPNADQLAFFEAKVRPLLVERCHKCHAGDKAKGELWLDSASAILHGGDSGPAVVPGKPDESLLIGAVRYESFEMPPSGKLADDEIAILERWVTDGAYWPKEAAKARAAHEFTITEEDKHHWAFQPIVAPEVPLVNDTAWSTNPIDAFVRAKLDAAGIAPNPPAERRELIRRVFYDLIGLPPTPEQWQTWLSDAAPDWYERLLDDLLARPQYGERWARHWLDVVRYAQSNGYERDDEKPYAWRYRDWVIQSLNADLPYDRFILEQLAGDELPDATPQSLIATGFYRLGVWDDEPDDKQMAEFDALDDIVSTVGAAFLGLSVGCARCHDHKFDPLPQEDYYRLLACFRNVRPYEIPKEELDSPVLAPLATPQEVAAWQSTRGEEMQALEAELATLVGPASANAADCAPRKAEIEAALKRLKDTQPPFEWALAVRESGASPPETHVLTRGQAAQRGRLVHVGVPRIFTACETRDLSALPCGETSSGLRRAVAEWIASEEHPLTARVIANRVWQHHFGKGLVATANDFGRAGLKPTHPELLDWLASRFMADGWSLKRLHKRIMTSETYRLSSRTSHAAAMAADPDNSLLWRQSLRRVEAEALRDAVLSVTGQLNPAMGGRGIFPRLSREVLAGQSRPGLGWEISTPEEERRRSVYIFVKRTMLAPMLEGFDYTNTAQPIDSRPVTTVAPQSLQMLNSRFITEQAAAFAERLRREVGDQPEAQIDRAYWLALGREPRPSEREIALAHLAKVREQLVAQPLPLTVRPEAPTAISVGYLNRLRPSDFLSGAPSSWNYGRGDWIDLGEGIFSFDVERGPFVLSAHASVSECQIEAEFLLHANSELGSLVYQGENRDGKLQGYELRCEPLKGTIGLFRIEGETSTRLAEIADAMTTGVWRSVKIERQGRRHRVWLDGAAAPAIDVAEAAPIEQPGRFGLRTWGSPLSIRNAYLTASGARQQLDQADETVADLATKQALRSFCLLVLNLNEFVYVD